MTELGGQKKDAELVHVVSGVQGDGSFHMLAGAQKQAVVFS